VCDGHGQNGGNEVDRAHYTGALAAVRLPPLSSTQRYSLGGMFDYPHIFSHISKNIDYQKNIDDCQPKETHLRQKKTHIHQKDT